MNRENQYKIGVQTQHIFRIKGLSFFQICLFGAWLLALSACFKEKPMAPPVNDGIGQTAVIEMGPSYADQYFYSLETNTVLSYNSRFDYDLMFECSDTRFYIWLNTAKFMCALNTGKSDLSQVTMSDTVGKNWFYELGEFNDDSNAIGQWWSLSGSQPISKNDVYLLNLGVDDNNTPFGFVKLQIKDFNGSSYSIAYSDINSQEIHTALIQKDPTRNYRYFTFGNGGSVVDGIEPDKTKWDFCFTRYSVVFYEPYYLPYQVTGVLNNPSKVSAYLDSTVTFKNVTIADMDAAKLQSRRDVIGYEWKRYELGDYTTKTWYTYFIKTDEDKFYKFRFLDYKKAGVWGYPTFEYYRL